MKKILPAVVILLFPTLVFAAGFAKQTLFLSQTSVTEGDTVLIHVVVSNDTQQKFTGSLEFTDNTNPVGTVPAILIAGEASTLSISWKPSAGSHNVVAKLEDSNKNVIEENLATFSIAAKTTTQTDTPVSQVVTPVDSSQQIQQTIAKVSPTVAQDSAPVFSTIDSARASAAKALDNGILWSKQQIAQSITSKNKGNVLGIQTQKADATSTTAGGITQTAWMLFATATLYILSILRYLIGSAGIFYPLFAILFLLILWKLFRRFRRRR